MIKCICDVAVSRAASVTKEVYESGGGDKDVEGDIGDGDADGVAGLVVGLGVVDVAGPVG